MQAVMQALWLWYSYGSVSALKTSWSKVSMDARTKWALKGGGGHAQNHYVTFCDTHAV